MSSYSFEKFLIDHNSQIKLADIPQNYLFSLHTKLLTQTYDAGENFELNKINFIDEETREIIKKRWQLSVVSNNIGLNDSSKIFLVDHAWTFKLNIARQMLLENASLLTRMANIFNIDNEDITIETQVIKILEEMWRFCRLYQLSLLNTQSGDQPVIKQDVWYILDEVGSSITHSQTPTVRIVPFMYVPDGLCYSIFWPIKQMNLGDVVSADFVNYIPDSGNKQYLLLPWVECDFSDESAAHSFVFTDEFFNSHRNAESLPVLDDTDKKKQACGLDKPDYILKVYTDLSLVSGALSSPNFCIVDNEADADIFWTTEHFFDFRKISDETPSRYINQFPNESILTVKDLLAALSVTPISIEVSGIGPELDLVEYGSQALSCSWYPLTFNLMHELPQFVAYFQRRQNLINLEDGDSDFCSNGQCFRNDCSKNHAVKPKGNTNVWIVKPWNLGRGIGIFVTDNLIQILRHVDCRPMIASRYLTDPVLYYRKDINAHVKFDIRYIVLLRSVEPLTLFIHKVFWLRFANKQFSLENYDDYSKHFTVMNYCEDDLKQIHHDEFIEDFSKQYPNVVWENVEAKIHQTLVHVFTVATSHPVPKGIGNCRQSRAMYAVDMMLEWIKMTNSNEGEDSTQQSSCYEMQPQLCEVNFSPDCIRACTYHPNFYNDIFECLFLDKHVETIQQLC